MWWQRFGFQNLRKAYRTWPRGLSARGSNFQVGGQEQFQDSRLSQLKSSADGVCQLEASPGMFVLAMPNPWSGVQKEQFLGQEMPVISHKQALPTLTPITWRPWYTAMSGLKTVDENKRKHLTALYTCLLSDHFTARIFQIYPTKSFFFMPTCSKQNLSRPAEHYTDTDSARANALMCHFWWK